MLLGESSSLDLERLSEMPDGVLEIDLLNRRAVHSVEGALSLSATDQLGQWLEARLDGLSIASSDLHEAKISAEYQTGRIATNRKKIISFDWRCQCILATDETEYRGQFDKHVWHTRIAP
jgi:hypothetical protein